MENRRTECIGGVSDNMWGKQFHQQDRVYSIGDVALCLPSQIPNGSYLYLEIKRIDENGKRQNSSSR